METNLSEAARWAEQERRGKIRLAKLEEIRNAWDDLFFILKGEEIFKKSKHSDYSSFEKTMRQAFEKTWQKHLSERNSQESGDVKPPGILLKQLGELLSVNFTPPTDGKDIAVDLIQLQEYYRSNLFFPSIEMALDLSLCKLIGAVNRLYGVARARGETILTGRKKQQKKVTDNIDLTEEAFYHLKTIPKNLQKIGKSIREYFLSKGKSAPSVKTIVRYMESSSKIYNDLIAMGIIKDKPTIVQ